MIKTWRYINESDVSASYGLGTDEYLTHMYSDYPENEFPAALRLYNYKNYSVLTGRFQDITAEIDLDACHSKSYDYSRRLTGGGAIIMGADQLGVCLTTSSNYWAWDHIRELYKQFSKPLISALQAIGIDATFRSKNDLEVGGKKIAGLGVYISPKGDIQFHASVLLDLDVPSMLEVLNIPIKKYSDERKISSVRQRMTTIRTETGIEYTIDEIKTLITHHYSSEFGKELIEQPITEREKNLIHKYEERYRSEEWIYQRSPQKDMTGNSLKRTNSGLLRTYIGLKGEHIKSVLITGDFMENQDLFLDIEAELKWSPLDKGYIEARVQSVFSKYSQINRDVLLMNADDITDAIWVAAQRALAEKKYNYQGSCYYPKQEEETLKT